jgi:hypothetical protein
MENIGAWNPNFHNLSRALSLPLCFSLDPGSSFLNKNPSLWRLAQMKPQDLEFV